MSVADHVLMISLGRTPDPLFEEIIASEGYQVVHASSTRHAFKPSARGAYAAVAILVAEDKLKAASEFIRRAAKRLPEARFILASPNGAVCSVPEVDAAIAERVLCLQGEPGEADNVEHIRRFLRGEGYHWGRDLEAQLDGATPLDATGRFGKGQEEGLGHILRFTGDLSRFTELRPMLQEALSRYLQILRCEAGSIYLWDETTETLVLEAAKGPDEGQRLGLRQKMGEGLAGCVAEVNEPILVTDSRKVHKLHGRTCRRYPNFSCIAMPVTHGGQLFGVVCLTMPTQGETFCPEDLRLAQNLSQKLASAIRPLTVLSELRRFSERLLGAFKSSSELLLEKDVEVETLRDFSRRILDNVPLAVIAYDRHLRVRFSNVVAGEMFGEGLVWRGASLQAPLEEGIEMEEVLWRRKLKGAVENGREFRLQRVGYQSDERKLMLDVHCSPLVTPGQKISGGILTVQDVTEDIEMERKLQSAERLAIVGKIAAKVAHELNNPLDGILRFISLALRQADRPEQVKTYLEESRHGLLRMSHIVSELLVFSRSHYAAYRPVSMSQVIHQGLAMYEARAREMNIRIEVDIPPAMPNCPSNEVWEVFGNVVKNALDAISQDGVLRVEARVEDLKAIIVVSDTGPGVPPGLGEKIFEPFFTTKKEGAGTGLGLAVCRDALRRIGGDIRLAPSENGATFEVVVPVKSELE